MVELAYTTDLKSVGETLWVRIPSVAPKTDRPLRTVCFWFSNRGDSTERPQNDAVRRFAARRLCGRADCEAWNASRTARYPSPQRNPISRTKNRPSPADGLFLVFKSRGIRPSARKTTQCVVLQRGGFATRDACAARSASKRSRYPWSERNPISRTTSSRASLGSRRFLIS